MYIKRKTKKGVVKLIKFEDFDIANWISFIALYPLMLCQLLFYSFIFAIEVTKNSVFGECSYSTILSESEYKKDNYNEMKKLVDDIKKGEKDAR